MVQQIVNEQFGKCLLELSGNNAIIVMDDANIQLSVRLENNPFIGLTVLPHYKTSFE